jgi:hypothetical protein
VQDDAAHELRVEVAHVQHALAAFAADGERLGQQRVERSLQVGFGHLDRGLVAGDFLLRFFEGLHGREEARAELVRLGAQAGVGKRADLRLERVDLGDDRPHRLHVPLVLRAEHHGQEFVDHVG